MENDKFIETFEEYRVGNISVRSTEHWIKKDYYVEIVFYYPNEDYGQQDKYEWDEKRRSYKVPGYNCYKSPSCFVLKEHCYTIASVDFNQNEEEPDIKSVGGRTARLEPQEWLDYKQVIMELFKRWEEYKEQNYDD